MGQGARWMLLGLVVASLALVGWFLLDREDGERSDVVFDDGRGAFVPEDELGVAGDDLGDDDGPSLTGRTVEPRPAGPVRWGPVDVTVVGPSGVPLPNVLLEAVPPKPVDGEPVEQPQRATTLEDGRTRFANLPWDGSWVVRPVRADRVVDNVFIISLGAVGRNNAPAPANEVLSGNMARTSASAPVAGPTVRLRLDVGLPLSIEVVAAESGQVLGPAPWALQPDVQNTKGTVYRTPELVKVAAVVPGNEARLRPFLSTYQTYVSADDPYLKAWVSPRAHALVAQVPVRREAEVFVTLEDGVDVATDRDWSVRYSVGARMRGKAHGVPDAYGRVRIHGVPFLAGEPVRIGGKLRNKGMLSANGTFGADPYEPVTLVAHFVPIGKLRSTTLVKRELAAGVNVHAQAIQQLQLSAKRAQELTRMVAQEAEVRAAAAAQHARRSASPEAEPLLAGDLTGRLRVIVRTPKGKPAVGAKVHLGALSQRVNGDGVAFFTDLDPGDVSLRVVGAGAAFVAQGIVEPKVMNTLELTAPEGGSIDVEVVAEDGTPLPFARVELEQESGLPYADVQAGVQRVDSYVGHHGRRTFRAVAVGRVKVEAKFGTRSGFTRVEVDERGVVLARVVLARPPPPVAAKAPDVEAHEALERLQKERAALMEALRAVEELKRRKGGR